MRIALLTDGIWPLVIGGMQKHSYYLCKYLAQNGVYVDLYHTANDRDQVELSQWFSESELQYVRSFVVPFSKVDNLPGHYLRSSLEYSNRLVNQLRQNNWADLIYAKGLTSHSVLERKAGGEKIPPVCINVHGYEYFQKPASVLTYARHLLLRPAFRYINERADYIYSYGGRITDIIKNRIPNRRGTIIEIPAGIEKDFLVNDIGRVNQTRQFIFVGRFERRKGIVELNRAIVRILRDSNFVFHFVGDIPDSHKIMSKAVVYHGQVNSKARLQELLQASDVLVCPSYSEGMPNVILEAMASGCAVIASDVGAVCKQVSPANGWLIRPGSSKAVEGAIREAILLCPDQLFEMKQNALNLVMQDYLWEKTITCLIESFNNILLKNYPKTD